MNKKSPGSSEAGKKASRLSRGSGASRARPSARSATAQQRKYVAGRIAGKSKKRAAIEAGYAKSTASNAKQKIDRKPAVAKLFDELLEDAGVSNALLAKRMHDGLHATTVGRETKYAEREVLIDFSERREMLELALQVKGLLVEKHEVTGRLTLEQLLEESHGCDLPPKS